MDDTLPIDLVTEAEVADALEQCNFKKGIGPDGFDGTIFKKDETIKSMAIREIATMMNKGQVPDHLKCARLVPLTKIKGATTASIQDVRPIMIKSHIYKIMEKVILIKLKHTKSKMLMSGGYQNGFKEQRSTCNNLALVVKKFHDRAIDKRPSLLLIDLQKAYDSVDRQKLLDIIDMRAKTDLEKLIARTIRLLHENNEIEIG